MGERNIGVTCAITASGRIDLNEEEMRALHTMTLWGEKAFIETFKKNLGSDIGHWESGVKSLFKRINEQIPPVLRNLDTARELLGKHYKENP
jgi:hypothetical protein